MNQTMGQFEPDRDHLFSLNQGPAFWSGPWSGGGFTAKVTYYIKPIK